MNSQKENRKDSEEMEADKYAYTKLSKEGIDSNELKTIKQMDKDIVMASLQDTENSLKKSEKEKFKAYKKDVIEEENKRQAATLSFINSLPNRKR